MAAVLAAGPRAVLSHRSAAVLWESRGTSRSAVEVTAPGHCRRPRIESHRTVLAVDEVTTHRGIPVTTVARTLFYLAAVVGHEHVEAALTEAEVRGLTSPTALDALLARHPGRRGAATPRRILAKRAEIGRAVTRSDLEVAFLAFVDAHHLPRPRTNARVDTHRGSEEVDAAWPEHGLIAELDSFGIHTTRRNFEGDRAKDRALTAADWRVVRITWRQLHRDRDGLAEEVRTLLRPRLPTDTVPAP